MARLFSPQDIALLGYQSPSILKDGPGWTRLSANAEAGVERIEAQFIYIKIDCTKEQLASALRDTPPSAKTYALVPEKPKLTEASIREIVERRMTVIRLEDAIWRRLSANFAPYLQAIAQQVPEEQYFVQPRRENEAAARLDRELLTYLEGRGPIAPGNVAVVTASAGVGKTTVARKLVLQLARQVDQTKVIPVFVEASHWDKFNLQSDLELWDIIRNSVDQFGGYSGLSLDLFNYGLKQGYFVFVFDGFDELCSPKHSQFSPIDVLKALASLASQSEARILVTTRSLFWENEIASVGVPSNVEVIRLAPFNKQQAHGYFAERFKSQHKKQNQAQTLYSKLVKGSDLPENETGGARTKFANLPFVVVMLAEYVDRGGVNFESQGELIEDLLEQLCKRDKARQGLGLSAREQLRAFEDIAVDDATEVNPTFDLVDLEVVGFAREDIRDVSHHALLGPGRVAGRYTFRWDFVAPYMRALFLKRWLSGDASARGDQARKIMRLEANGKGFVFEHLFALLGKQELSLVSKAYQVTPRSDVECRSFLAHLAAAIVTEEASITTARERTQAFLSVLCPDAGSKKVFEGFSLIGQIERFDLSGYEFDSCEFKDAAFVQCGADRETTFSNCRFVGTFDINPDTSWHQVRVENCEIRTPASLTWDSVLERQLPDTEDLLTDAFRLGLAKFWHNGNLRDNIKKDDWKRGLLGRTRYCQPMLDALLRCRVLSESPVGKYTEPRLLFAKECFGELQKFMDSRQLMGRIADAFRSIRL